MTPADENLSRLRDILAQVLGTPADRIGPGFSAESAPEWTSLNHLMLISQLESEFGVFFTNQEVQQLTSFDRIAAAIAGRNQPGG
jgi:acyl carrier protein